MEQLTNNRLYATVVKDVADDIDHKHRFSSNRGKEEPGVIIRHKSTQLLYNITAVWCQYLSISSLCYFTRPQYFKGQTFGFFIHYMYLKSVLNKRLYT